MLKICYALALHIVASENKLPLPTFLMIDTPMKNIGEDVNEERSKAFYKNLYRYAKNELVDTQFIIIDKEYIELDIDDLDASTRYMTPDDEKHPPLIPYYSGA